MLEHLRSAKTVYPLFALLICLFTFFSGLLFVKQAWFLAYLLVLIVIHAIFGYGRTLVRVLPAFLLLGGAVACLSLLFATPMQAAQTGFRILLLGVSAIPTIGMPAINLVRVLNQIKCPRWLTLGLLIGLRFISIMAQEIRRIRIAMRLRGINSGWYNPAVLYRAFIIPLMMRILSISDLLALSLETRAFSMEGEVTFYKTIHIQKRDALYFALVIATCLACFLFYWVGGSR